MRTILCVCVFVGLLLFGGSVSLAEVEGNDAGHPPSELHASALGHTVKVAGDNSGLGFLFGAFCALWAQNTRRNPWLWFFLGLFFSVIAVIVLLVKNSDDNFDRRMYGRTTRDLELDPATPRQP